MTTPTQTELLVKEAKSAERLEIMRGTWGRR